MQIVRLEQKLAFSDLDSQAHIPTNNLHHVLTSSQKLNKSQTFAIPNWIQMKIVIFICKCNMAFITNLFENSNCSIQITEKLDLTRDSHSQVEFPDRKWFDSEYLSYLWNYKSRKNEKTSVRNWLQNELSRFIFSFIRDLSFLFFEKCQIVTIVEF